MEEDIKVTEDIAVLEDVNDQMQAFEVIEGFEDTEEPLKDCTKHDIALGVMPNEVNLV